MNTLYSKLATPHPDHKAIYDAITKSLIAGPRMNLGDAKRKFGVKKLAEAMTAGAVHCERVVEKEMQMTPEGMAFPLSTKLIGASKIQMTKVTIEVPFHEALASDLVANHGVIG